MNFPLPEHNAFKVVFQLKPYSYLLVTELAIQLHSKKDLQRTYDTQPNMHDTQPTP